MLNLFVFREKLRACYARFGNIIVPVLHFSTALLALVLLNNGMGYERHLRAPVAVLLISLLSAFLPWGGICVVLGIAVLLHIFAVSAEFALITLAFLLVLALLYYGFSPRDSVILILTPMLFELKLPYLLPILVGLGGSVFSVIPLSGGIVLYYIINYVHNNAAPLTNGESVDVAQKYLQMLNGVLLDKTLILYLLAFSISLLVVWCVRRLSMDYAWDAGILAGILTMLFVFFLGNFWYGVGVNIVPLLLGLVLAGLLAELYRFLVFSVDYTRTEYSQFEDDDYYYYVKAVPKITVAAPEPKTQTINTPKRSKRSADEGETKR